ncbi:MAG: branched-chain-amino-acid transaminase [Fibrobacter sp.]|mgnify:CR=1 FL=1|nr:branched-chain-amino-acid transaminase [Fibrobacter sp.]
MLIYIDGEFYEKAKAKISVFDHGFLYGDGVFEGIRAYNGKVFKLDEHIDRLYESAKVILLDPGVDKEEMKEIVLETCRKNQITDGYIRLVVSRGVGDLGLNPNSCKKASVICIAGTIQLYPEKYYSEGLKIITVPTTRNNNESLNPRIKSLNYLNNILAKIEGLQAGAPEALMLNPAGMVAECTGDNVFVIKGNVLHTPDVHSGSLDGITRRTVMDLARERGMEVVEGPMSRFDIWVADEFFLTGTAAEVVPVVELDQRVIGDGKPGPQTIALMEDYSQYVRSHGAEIQK